MMLCAGGCAEERQNSKYFCDDKGDDAIGTVPCVLVPKNMPLIFRHGLCVS